MGRRQPASRKVPVVVCLTMVALIVGAVAAIWLVDRSGPQSGPVLSDSAAGISARLTLAGPNQISVGRPARVLVTNVGSSPIAVSAGVDLQRSNGLGWNEAVPGFTLGAIVALNFAILQPGTTAQIDVPPASAAGNYRVVVPLWPAHKLTLTPPVEGAVPLRVAG